MDQMTALVQSINSWLWGITGLIPLLVGVGIYFTFRLNFVQIRKFGQAMRFTFHGLSLHGERAGKAGMTSFQSLATAVAAQVGTGNIAGAATAIAMGGPGAIFWMWIAAFFGMATIFSEAVLAQLFKTHDDKGHVTGGPAYYITNGLHCRPLAIFFSIAIILALGFIGCMVQSNSIAETMNNATGIPGWAVGVVIAAVAGFIFIGNLHRLASVTEKLVPLMAIIYLIGGLVVLIMNAGNLPAAISLIFTCAFNPSATLGGAFFGLIAALTQGAKRGLFSNEAGMGSTPHAHALANVKDPHEQGVVAMIGVFVDTIVVVTMTALVVISVLYVGDGPLASAYENAGKYETVAEFVSAEGDAIAEGLVLDASGNLVNADGDAVLTNDDMKDPAALAKAIGISKTNMAQLAFGAFFTTGAGNVFVAICLLFFAFSTILSWNLFGKLNVQWLFRKRGSKIPVLIYSLIGVAFVLMGSLLQNDLVWELQDMFNQLMVIPNAIALFALSGWVVRCAKARGTKTDEIMAEKL